MRLLPLTLLALALALALAGCAATAPTPSTRPLLAGLVEMPVEPGQSLTLPATLAYAPVADGRGAAATRFYLLAGPYRPYKWNALGTFYLGEQPAVLERQASAAKPGKTFLHIGGIWIPRNPAAAPKFFVLPDHYKQVDDAAPLPAGMTAARLSDFRQAPTANGASVDPLLLTNQSLYRNASPLQAGLGVGIAIALIGAASQPAATAPSLAFVTPDIVDPALVGRIRTTFSQR